MPHDGPCKASLDPRAAGRCYKCGKNLDEAPPQVPPEKMAVAQPISEQEFSKWLASLDTEINDFYQQLAPAMERNETWAFEAHQKIVVVLTALHS